MNEKSPKNISMKWLKRIALLITGLCFCFLLLLISLRWINPPFTAFTLQENWEELGVESYNLKDYWIPYQEIPKNVQWAVVASEDQRFWEHKGLDFVAIEKALEENEEGGQIRGASTISQQVSKNLFLSGNKSYIRKGIEAGITFTIELLWTKERIMEMYLNIAEFGPGIYGIGKASDYFFDKAPQKITNDEAARLAVVLPNPKRMRVEPPSPFVLKRKNWVLRNMTQLSGITYLPKADSEPKSMNSDSGLFSNTKFDSLSNRMRISLDDFEEIADSLFILDDY